MTSIYMSPLINFILSRAVAILMPPAVLSAQYSSCGYAYGGPSQHPCFRILLCSEELAFDNDTLWRTIKRTMNVTTISKFRKHAKDYFDQVIDNQDVLLLTRSDGQTVVVMTLDQYNSKVETDYLNSSPVNRQHLENSLASLRAGELEKHTLIEH